MISVILVTSLLIRQYFRYEKIMSEQKFTVCKTTKLTSSSVRYQFKIKSVEYVGWVGFQDPNHKIGTYYLLVYYPKDPTINCIIYQEVRDSSSYGESANYPNKFKVYFWRF